jgi:dihydrofolate reductase
MYEFMTDTKVIETGFILDNSGEFGCSPDGLVGEDGGLEIKCPAPHNHVDWSRKKVCPSKHYAQVQGCMWITGRKWWDFMSYHPDMKPFIVRVERDEEFIEKLAKEVILAVTEIISEVRNLK